MLKRRLILAVLVSVLSSVSLLPQPTAASPVASTPTTLAARPDKVIPDQYIVVLKDGSDARAAAAVAGIRPKHVYTAALNGFAAELNDGQLRALEQNPDVAYIEQDQAVDVGATQFMDSAGDPWGLDRIDQRALPLSRSFTYNATGAGVTAYIIDSGLQANHPDFGGRAQNVYDALGGNGVDCNGHGTHVAGTIGGNTYGVAKQVQLRGVRVFPCSGGSAWSTIIAGIDWVRIYAARPAIANLSLGGGYSAAVDSAMVNLINSGVFAAVSAGNNNGADACGQSPASTAAAYTVAASDRNDQRASFSNIGGCVDTYAPGVAVKSAWLNSGTNTINGTSMAAPHAAGVAAAYLSTRPGSTPAQISSWLTSNATPNVIGNNPAGTPNRLLHLPDLTSNASRPKFDYDGDGMSDLAVWRPNNGTWYVIQSTNGAQVSRSWGLNGDIPTPGDYDGDRKTDLAVWRPSNGTWYIIYSSTGQNTALGWGLPGDIPTPGDYDGDRKTDLAVWRPGNGTWYIIYSSTGQNTAAAWGLNGDKPTPGDYDGDGKTDLTVWRPSNATWYTIYSSTGQNTATAWGFSDDIPTPGDYDGDRKTDLTVWRPGNGTWYIIYSSTGQNTAAAWGLNGDIPTPGDYDGDRRTDLAVWRPNNGTWYIIYSSNGQNTAAAWGLPGDIPIR